MDQSRKHALDNGQAEFNISLRVGSPWGVEGHVDVPKMADHDVVPDKSWFGAPFRFRTHGLGDLLSDTSQAISPQPQGHHSLQVLGLPSMEPLQPHAGQM